MVKAFYILIALTSSGDEYVIDSQLTASDCLAAISATNAPYKTTIGGIELEFTALLCEAE